MDAPRSNDGMDSGIACLAGLARLYEVAVDPDQVRHEFARAGRTLDADELVRAARWLGLKARRTRATVERLATLPLPAIAELDGGEFVILAAARDDRVLLQRADGSPPKALDHETFASRWSGTLVLVTRRAGLLSGPHRFGFSWFLPFILKYRVYLGEALLASVVLQLLALISPLFFQVVIDKVLVHRGLTTLDILAVGLFGVAVFETLLGGLRVYVLAHTGNRIDVALGAEVFRHLLRLPVAWFEARRVGDTVTRLRELETIRGFLTGSAISLVVDAAFTGVFFTVLYLYSPALTLVVAACLPAYAVLALALTPVLRLRLEEKFNRGADNHAFLVESIAGIEALKAAAVEPATRRRWEERLAGYVQASFDTTKLANVANQLAAFVNKLMVLAILWLGAHRVMAGELSVGQLVAFNMIAARIAGPFQRLMQLWQDFQQVGIALRRLGDILDAVPEAGHRAGRRSLPQLRGEVRFDRVDFRYVPDGRLVLEGLDLHVEPGEIVGIVGPSGSGKSTLARLIQRLHVPERGRVMIDGIDLAMIDSAWLRRQTAVVLQESRLFNRSVRDNIALSDPAVALDRVVHAARLAGAHEFIVELPSGYDTPIVEQGANLSGGQRQRIAIARALLGDPRILVFDEATSALDYESEAIIAQNMRYICKGRTVFIIAHRLSAVRLAKRIVVLDHGRIIEQGTHAELAARGGYYAGLLRHQQR